MKKVLVTGGLGFIGSNLVRRLLVRGYEVSIFTQSRTESWRLYDCLSDVVLYDVDLADTHAIEKGMQQVRPDIIFHLASFGGFPNQQDAKLIYDVNFYGTMALFKAAKKIGFDCFINTGSSSEYGIKSVAMAESMVLEPVSDYAVSKAAATQFCLKQALFDKLPVYTIRPFSAYGDAELGSRLIPYVVQSLLNKTLMQLASQHNVRDYIYVHDLVDIYLAVMDQRPEDAFLFNGGTGVCTSTAQLIQVLQSFWAEPIVPVWGAEQSRPWEPQVWKADTTQIEKVLGYTPQTTLEQGLKKTIAWFENHQFLYDPKKENYGQTVRAV